MATTKKTTTKTTKPVTTEETVPQVTKNVETTKTAPKKFAPDERIECRSITGGELILIGPKTKLQYIWSDYGDTAYVEYQDLQALQSMRSGFIVKPRFIIEDEDLVKQWKGMLKPIYDKITDQTIEDLFTMDAKRFETILTKMPDGMKETIKTKAAQMIKSGELDSLSIIKAIDSNLGTEFITMFLG